MLGVYQKDKTGTTNGFLPREGTLLPNINGYIPRNRFVGDPNNDIYQTETGAISSLLEHSFNDAVKFTQNLRYAHVDGVYAASTRTSMATPSPRIPHDARSPATPQPGGLDDNFTADNNLQIKAVTGALEHKMLFGVDYRDFFARSSVAPFSADATPFDSMRRSTPLCLCLTWSGSRTRSRIRRASTPRTRCALAPGSRRSGCDRTMPPRAIPADSEGRRRPVARA